MRIRTALPADIPTIVAWRKQTAAWLANQGSDQWSVAGLPDEEFRSRVWTSVESGETWMAEMGGQTVGTAAIDQWSDTELWTRDELRGAMIIHRMIVPREYAGYRVGEYLLDHADRLALRNHRSWLRLDAWTTNRALHDYYLRQGFRHVRDVPGKVSGALFERSVNARVVTSTRRLASSLRELIDLEPGEDRRGNPAPPEHWRIVDDLVVERNEIRGGGRHPAELTPTNSVRIRFDARKWRYSALRGMDHADTIVEWPLGLILDPAQEYVLREIDNEAVLAVTDETMTA